MFTDFRWATFHLDEKSASRPDGFAGNGSDFSARSLSVPSSPIYGHLEVGSRSRPKRLSEGCDESTRGTIACFKSCVSDLGALAKQAHRLHQAELLPPFSQRHSCFFLKKPLHGSSARTHRSANASEGLPDSLDRQSGFPQAAALLSRPGSVVAAARTVQS